MSMTIQQIIDKINSIYPNTWTNSDFVDAINELQRRLYRKMKIRTSSQYDLLASQAEYPITIPQDQIIQNQVFITYGTVTDRYIEKNLRDFATDYSKYYYFIENFIGLFPTPTQTGTMLIYHYESPTTLVSTNLTATPDLDGDYHKVFVYGVAAEITEGYRDTDMGNIFVVKYNEIEDELMSHFFEPETETIESRSGW